MLNELFTHGRSPQLLIVGSRLVHACWREKPRRSEFSAARSVTRTERRARSRPLITSEAQRVEPPLLVRSWELMGLGGDGG